ncbi:chemotaxis protein [Duganella sp. FT109W]|uniref:Chemotaxis protein n=1 Tax=Duganella margarita TaxID=2692170 RepID=A0ABW9WIE3_9BURK|nr:CheR family methyltransferase [Duganella margarita]MYN40165.1 chemotaxis protein [Duganella margarita]
MAALMRSVTSTVKAARRHSPSSVEELELELLLEALYQCHGYDFRGYDHALVARKVQALRLRLGLATISALQSRVLHDDETYNTLLRALYVSPALMFDDPLEVSMLRLSLGVSLHGAALPRVWLADCASPQQAWTLAILLEQEQLAPRTEIYATVASDTMLADAQHASLPMARLDELQANYVRSGGVGKLVDYFDVDADGLHAALKPELASRITWAQYNLVTDASFNEFQMILGQRTLPDFGLALRKRVLQLFDDSLAPFGMLALDRPLDDHDPLSRHYKPIMAGQPWYKRVA